MKDDDAIPSFLMRALKDESGQVLAWMVFLFSLFLGLAGLTLDLGHAYTCYQQLQDSTDAATLAGAYAMSLTGSTTASVTTMATNYSSATGGANINGNLPNTAIVVNLKCLQTVTNLGVLCAAGPGGTVNAIQVVQTTTIPTLFIRGLSIFGIKGASSLTLATASTAAMRGAQNAQYNVAMVVDTTQSMSQGDGGTNCSSTKIACALQGVQVLLSHLTPCTSASVAAGSCSAFDQVSLFTFPAISANTAQYDNSCTSGTPNIVSYPVPAAGGTWTPTNFTSTTPTYQITNYLSDYSSTNQSGGALSSTSALGIATGAGVSTKKNPCEALQPIGGVGTYFAGAVYAALSSLAAAQTANPGSQNALIILSDGDASATSANITGSSKLSGATYGSAQDQCAQAVAAAKTANSMTQTTVYAVAYGAPASGCSTDVYNAKTNPAGTNITPCQTLQQMATNASTFYSDQTGHCTSTTPALDLAGIFTNIATQFTVARLIPNGSS